MNRFFRRTVSLLCTLTLLAAFSLPCLAAGRDKLVFENRNTLLVTGYYIVGIREDGTLRICETYEDTADQEILDAVETLENVVSLCETDEGFAALMADGTVAEICYYRDEVLRRYDWTNVEEIIATGYALLGRRSDGTVYVSEPEAEHEEEYFAFLEPVRKWKNIRSLSTVHLDWNDGPVFAFGKGGEFYYTEWEHLVRWADNDWGEVGMYEDFHAAMESVDSEDDIFVGTNILVVGDMEKPENCYVFYASPYGGYEYDAYTSVTRNQLAALKEAGERPVDILANREDIMFLLADGTVTHCLNAEMATFMLYPDGSRDWYQDPVHEPIPYPADALEFFPHADTADLRGVVAMSSFDGATDTEPFIIYHLQDGTLVARGDWLPDLTLEDWTDIRLPSSAEKVVVTAETLTFGSYQGEALEWFVVEEKDGKQLLVCRNSIACRPYHERYGSVTWERSDLRAWLNDDFYNSAFSDAEQERIEEAIIHTGKNKAYNVPGGRDTVDKVFLLSTEEAAKYFDEDDRWASPTKAALKEASANDAPEYEWYWLRTPGQNGRYVAGISADGGIRYGGYSEGSYGYVRPAIWIDP